MPLATAQHVIVLFDGECSFCNAGVRFLIQRDPKHLFQFATQQSDVGRRLLADAGFKIAPQSVVVIDGQRVFTKSRAILRIPRYLSPIWRILGGVGMVLPLSLANRLYDVMANNRYRWFKRVDVCELPRAGDRARFLSL